MKKFILLFYILLSVLAANAQFIHGFTAIPANPTTDDQIKILVQMSFPSGGCGDHQQFYSANGNMLSASALHCLGPLAVICSYTDTFNLGQLAAGNYKFFFNVNIGGGPSPCSPGIVPGPSDSLPFIVSQAATINELSDQNISIKFNSLQKKINLSFNSPIAKGKATIYSITGQMLQTEVLTFPSQSIAVDKFPAGLYLLEITGSKGKLTKRLVIQE
jgi:hypothetical protein